MADAVTTIVELNGKKRYIARFTGISDGTGESAVVKVDKSTLTNSLGVEPSKLAIEEINWSIQGFASVRLLWDHTTDDLAEVLAQGNGHRKYWPTGPGIVDPGSSGGTGDLLLTSSATTGGTYDIRVVLGYR